MQVEPPRTGSRLVCATCGTEVVVVRAPGDMPSCCGAPLAAPVQEVGDAELEAAPTGVAVAQRPGAEGAKSGGTASFDLRRRSRRIRNGVPIRGPSELGKRYACDVCGAVYLVVKLGAGSIECHGQSADEQVAKQLPSSD